MIAIISKKVFALKAVYLEKKTFDKIILTL